MPLYEYQCESCGRRFEEMQRVGDPPLETCAECGGKLRKLLSAPAFQFKGSGWYVTDYARAGGGSRSSGGSEPSESAKAAAAEKSDAKDGAAKEATAKSDGDAKPAAPAPSTSPKD